MAEKEEKVAKKESPKSAIDEYGREVLESLGFSKQDGGIPPLLEDIYLRFSRTRCLMGTNRLSPEAFAMVITLWSFLKKED